MFKRLVRGLTKFINRLFRGPSPPEAPPEIDIPVDFEPPEPEPAEEPETEFFDYGYDEPITPSPDYVEVVARAKYSSSKGSVGAEVHFFLERDHEYTASELQSIFQKWVATGEHPKDMDISILNWETTSIDDRGRVHKHYSDEHAGPAEYSINKGMRSALRKARINF